MPKPTLLGLSYSPWTERARWALEHHGIAHTSVEHTPLLGERALRARAKKGGVRGKASVPLWHEQNSGGDVVIMDSFAIMQHADRVGSGPSLRTDDERVRALVVEVEKGLQAMRMMVTARTLNDRQALKEAATVAVPAFLAGAAVPVAEKGAQFIAKKWGFDPASAEGMRPQVQAAIDVVRAALDGKDTVLAEGFSAADIVVATMLQGITPAPAGPKLKPATAKAWTDSVLAKNAADLLAWRDSIYATYRHRREPTVRSY